MRKTVFRALSRAVNYHKVDSKGIDIMCKAVEEYANQRRLEILTEGKIEAMENMLKYGFALNRAFKYADFDEETYNKYAKPVR